MLVRTFPAGAAALLICGVLAACGGSGSGNGVELKPADQIVTAASNAISHASTVHVAGAFVSQGLPLSLDMSLVSGKGGQGQMAASGLSFRIVALGQDIYIKGTPAFWRHYGGAVAAALLDGKWLKAPANGQLASLSAVTNIQQLFGKILQSHDALKKGTTTNLNGQKAIAVNDTTQGLTLYVATTGKPYPVRVVKGGASGGRIVFDRINQPVSLTPPPNAVDLSQLR